MPTDLNTISQISIYLKTPEIGGRVNEVALFHPLNREDKTKPLQARVWKAKNELTFHKKLILEFQSFIFHHIKILIPTSRKTPEAKFKTVMALLLSTVTSREFFLGNQVKREHFFEAAKKGALFFGYQEFECKNEAKIPDCARELTRLASGISLIEDAHEFQLQLASLDPDEKNEALHLIVDHLERPPLSSVVEIETQSDVKLDTELTTIYGRVRVTNITDDGKIFFTFENNKTTSWIFQPKNWSGVLHQRKVLDQGEMISSFCGELSTKKNILEQLLFVCHDKEITHAEITENLSSETGVFILTSTYSWTEYHHIMDQHKAIDELHGKTLELTFSDGSQRNIGLILLHQNLNLHPKRFPIPAEMKGHLEDINDAFLMQLTSLVFKSLNVNDFKSEISEARQEHDFLKKEDRISREIDHFRIKKKDVCQKLEGIDDPAARALLCLLRKEDMRGNKLNGIDALIHTAVVVKTQNFIHNYNGGEKSSEVPSLEKAGHTFYKTCGKYFLPGSMTGEEEKLFKVFYTMYSMWEEPEINPEFGMENSFQSPPKNPYLLHWLEDHSEVHLS